jgi:hypothetical protein
MDIKYLRFGRMGSLNFGEPSQQIWNIELPTYDCELLSLV